MNQHNTNINIIIVNYNTWKDTIECIDSIQSSLYKKISIFIIDNNSSDASVENIQDWVASNENFHLINSNQYKIENDFQKMNTNLKQIPLTIYSSNENLGFAKANNIYLEKIIKKDKNEFILMLNPDTTLYPNTLTELVKSHNTKDLEIVGLKINEYATNELITNGGYSYFSLTGSIKRNLLSNNKKLSYIHGGAVFLNSLTLRKAGTLPTDYFLYFEDNDWCYNAINNNINLTICNTAVCKDKVGTSIGRGFLAQYYYTFNVLLFTKKFFIKNLVFVSFFQVLRFFYFLMIKLNLNAAIGILNGLADFILHGKRKIKIN
jgi:GT2 family glycosyltransferase